MHPLIPLLLFVFAVAVVDAFYKPPRRTFKGKRPKTPPPTKKKK